MTGGEAILRGALRRLDPADRVARALRDEGVRAATVLAVGKAAARMAAGARDVVASGVAVVPPGEAGDDPRMTWLEGAHPTPDASSERAGRALLDAAAAAPRALPIVALISGGASALAAVPAPGLALADKLAVTSAVMAGGAPIAELNAVRKHLSAIKGGRLAAAAAAPVLTLIASDVVGDEPATVGSGPTVPDPTTTADAIAVVRRYAAGAGADVLARAGETPKRARPGDRARLVAGIALAGEAAVTEARALGYDAELRDGAVVGDVARVAERVAAWAREVAGASRRCIVAAGEPTLAVPPGSGAGGRAQHLALLTARKLAGVAGVRVIIAGTDGIDGDTAAAGAVIDGGTWRPEGEAALAAFDASTELAARGALVVTGRTGVNHADLIIVTSD